MKRQKKTTWGWKIKMAEEIKTEKTQIEEIEEQRAKELEQEKQVEGSEEKTEKKEKPKKERIGILYINATKNNTILTLTDMAGNTISRATGGQSTKQDRLKSSPTVAMFSSKKIAEDAKEAGVTSFYVRIRADTGATSPSSAAHAVIKSLSRDDFKIISILDLTRTPRGGPKIGGGRRGRRV
jgi:small subunit ribosomal protein S11